VIVHQSAGYLFCRLTKKL